MEKDKKSSLPLKTRMIYTLVFTVLTTILYTLITYYLFNEPFSYTKTGFFMVLLALITWIFSPFYLKPKS